MQETGLKIKLLGDKGLRSKSIPVSKVTPEHRDLLSKMAAVMYDNQGIGLAAPQIGVNEQIIIADIGNGLYKLINPRIVKKEGIQTSQEGCLSVPGVSIKVKRASKISVVAMDEEAKALTIEAQGLLACVLQHEIDHLKGKLIVDYADFLEKLALRRKLRFLRKNKPEDGQPPALLV